MKFLTISILLVAIVMTGACQKNAIVTHPGAVNSFDSNAYDTLTTAQASINAAKQQVGSTPSPTVKAALNTVIAAYNAAMQAYQTYHAAAVAGGVPDQTALQAQLTQLVASVAALTGQIKAVTK